MRNWTSHAAFRIAQFLFYYRLVGVVLFELTDERLMLLLFPNTFEYFFIAYELARSRYEPSRFSARFWLLVAAGLWIFVKLPQEYWIHIAQLDFTDAVQRPSGVRRRRSWSRCWSLRSCSCASCTRGSRRPTGRGGWPPAIPAGVARRRARALRAAAGAGSAS